MDHYSILDRSPKDKDNTEQSPGDSAPDLSGPPVEEDVPQGPASETEIASPSEEMHFPGDDGGQSLAAMAERDLDATLQLLADRAQYITGSSGAAIALRRGEHNDMLCRASAGSNAPELGALLSTEFGLSGESVRTRLPLRCDDAERDPRVNREGCRQLGIASVVVMPIVSDEIVLGVFELFSGRVNAFDERDLSALQRLSEMVETAVKLAHAAEHLSADILAPAISDEEQLPAENFVAHDSPPHISEEVQETDLQEQEEDIQEEATSAVAEVHIEPVVLAADAASAVQAFTVPVSSTELIAPAAAQPASKPSSKPLFWSADLTSAPLPNSTLDQSHIPPVLRSLRKCQACGFPVSEGRTLCVECEEKQWRGQPRAAAAPVPSPITPNLSSVPALAEKATASERSQNSLPVMPNGPTVAPGPVSTPGPVATIDAPPALILSQAAANSGGFTSTSPRALASESVSPPIELSFLGSGTTPSESWLSANKYILGALAAGAAAIAALALLR